MFLKRFIILAAGVLLSIAAFVVYFEYSHAQMEDRFRAEREKYHLDHLELTAATASGETTAHAPAATQAAPDTNALIGPVPPPAPSATPDAAPAPSPAPDAGTTPAPAPATSDSNAAPSTPSAPSTFNYPLPGAVPIFQWASYRPGSVNPFLSAVAIGQTKAQAPQAAVAAPAAAADAAPEAQLPPVNTESSVIVLLFHQFRPAGVPIPAKDQWTMHQDVFESEMKYIHDNGYHVVPMSDVLAFIKHEKTLPAGSVCITIDDGYKSAITYAAPILKKYGYPWTFFIYPAFITVNEGIGAASWNDLLELQKEGIDIESHSMTHPILTKKGSKSPEQYAAWLENETAGSKKVLEEHMGKTINCFAYPFGEYNKQVEAAAIAAGYEAIFTVADNPVHSTTNLHSIGRYTITTNVEKNFAAYLHQSALSLTQADPGPGATISNPQPVITAVLTQMSADALDPASLETSIRDFGVVRHDFDPQTNTVRIYLPRPLVSHVVLVNLRVKDAKTGQIMVANWHFNYEPGAGAVFHPPIPSTAPSAPATTNAAPVTETGTPLDAHPVSTSAPAPLPHTD